MHKILVSSCLLGAKVRYHGGDAVCTDALLRLWAEEGRLVSVCPEVSGGLPTPRAPAEIQLLGGDRGVGDAGQVTVTTREGRDVSSAFRAGATTAVDTARRHGIKLAILKDGSPSCGSSLVYDGTFSGTTRSGRGVTAAHLESRGVRVFSESQIVEAAGYLAELESADAG